MSAGLALAPNNLTMRETCPACGHEHKDANIPFWLFLWDRALCGSCAESIAPRHTHVVRDLASLWCSTDERARAIIERAAAAAGNLVLVEHIVNESKTRAMIETARADRDSGEVPF